ncbi:hypothetical protein D0T50_05900 [Bacteroides sp. 214]|uniref:sensor histidine kinase n=1 Tax=Bacteroides sp. 214 TaxID=2302935 RepID=UPI0013D15503|nr:ATP-binding protein [Bacteroides sp. 214]NDW12423.1 hypothetical protein [Bacteroides sp. 214]
MNNQDNTISSFSAEMAENVINSIPDMIFIVDSEYSIRRILNNDPAKLSAPVESLIGLSVVSIVSDDCKDEIRQAIDRALKSDEVQEVEYTLAFGDATEFFEGRFKRVNESLVACFERNITVRKNVMHELKIAKEAAEESDKLKSLFLANMSHEIRTPLNAIVGFSDLLTHTDDQETKEEFISLIKKNNDLLLQLINDILDLSKIESNTLEFYYDYFNINDILTKLEATARSKETTGKITISAVPALSHCIIHSAMERVYQVMQNFMNNALKFTREGEIKIGYEVLDEGIRFFVSDTGIGIPKDKQAEIFQRFAKIDNFVSGTGLGLSICETIVQKFDGTIGVDSELGKGSTFWFMLPVKPLEV